MTEDSYVEKTCPMPLSEFDTLCQVFFEHSAQGILITDAEARIIAANPAFRAITGYSIEDMLGHNPRLLHSGRQDTAFYSEFWDHINRLGYWEGELWNRRRSGELYRQRAHIRAVYDADGQVVRYICMCSDITEQHHSIQQLDYLSNHDPLTGLVNARRLREQLDQAIDSASAHRQRLGVFYIDVDHYNEIIASHGHCAGDQILRQLGDLLADAVAPGDLLAHLSKDTFVVIAEVTHGFATASSLAAHYQAICAQPVECAGHEPLTLTISVGVAIYPEDGEETHDLLRSAASALLAAKRSGQSSIAFYRPEITIAASQRLALEGALRKALIEHEFLLHYQPLVDPLTGTLMGAEALLRWQHGDELKLPGSFIGLAESSDLILALGRWVIELALRQIRAWREAGLNPPRISVNVSERQIIAGQLAEEIETLLRRYALEPDVLQIEVIERVLLHDPDQALCELERIRALGVSIALDDFGTGYSSLSYLTRFPVDCLKIDRSFVSELANEPRQRAIVRAILSMARNLGIRTVAEGVEEAAQLHLLTAEGCDLVQGYLFSHPLPPPAFAELLKHGLGDLDHLLTPVRDTLP